MSQGREVPRDESVDSDLIAYRAVSGVAIASLLLGTLSLVAVFAPTLWVVPVLGILLSWIALARVAAAGSMVVGRTAALLGLALSIASLTAVPAQLLSTRWWLVAEAQPIAEQWFEALRQGDPFQAHELSLLPTQRMQMKVPLAQYYGGRPEAKEAFKTFLSQPLTGTLLALKDGAKARLYDTEKVETGSDADMVQLVYAVTYEDGEGKKSFFVRMTLERIVNPDTGHGMWRILSTDAGIHPASAPK